jgi:predicted aminopeptidase
MIYTERGGAFEEPTRKGKIVPDDRSVADMVDGVLARQAAYRASQTSESFEDALQTVIETAAGRQLQELRSGPHCHARADTVSREPVSGRQPLLGSGTATLREMKVREATVTPLRASSECREG